MRGAPGARLNTKGTTLNTKGTKLFTKGTKALGASSLDRVFFVIFVRFFVRFVFPCSSWLRCSRRRVRFAAGRRRTEHGRAGDDTGLRWRAATHPARRRRWQLRHMPRPGWVADRRRRCGAGFAARRGRGGRRDAALPAVPRARGDRRPVRRLAFHRVAAGAVEGRARDARRAPDHSPPVTTARELPGLPRGPGRAGGDPHLAPRAGALPAVSRPRVTGRGRRQAVWSAGGRAQSGRFSGC